MSPVLFVLFRLFGKGVMRLDKLLQPLFEDMCVDLRGRNVRMAEEFLYDAQIGAIRQQVAGKGVAHDMR
jgi:hypothetical protein